jgi:amino acid adenylation domain-containing protein
MSSSSKRTFDLSVKKRALLESLLREQGIRSAKTERIPARQKTGPAPLSFAQQRLWFLNQLEPSSPLYNIHAAVNLVGSLNVPVLEQSINEILKRHEALRTTFAVVDERPVQIVNENFTLKLPVVSLKEVDEDEREQQVSASVIEEAHYPFDLATGPLLRAKLLQLSGDEHVLLLTIHHIVSDGWSMGIFVRELAVLYEAYLVGRPSPLPELPIQYADFAVWQREWLRGERLEEQLQYWKQQLAGSPPLLGLPTERARPPVQTFKGAHETLLLSESLSRSLKELSRGEGATLFMTLLAGFSCLLSRYSRQEDILIGTPIANRTRAETEPLIGFFINTLVLRTDLSGDPTFRALLRRVREVCLGAYAHQDLPFEKLVEELQPERSLSHSPLFQVMLDLQNAPMQALELQGLRLTPLEFDSQTAKFDLTLTMGEAETALSGLLEYNTDLFDAATIKRMIKNFQTLLYSIAANADERISRLPLLAEAEKRQLLVEWNDTGEDYATTRCVHEMFEQQAEATPDAVALCFGQQALSYGELNERANRLAHHLRRLGVGSEVPVGICVERSLEMVVGLIGILKAGGAYVPLDSIHPKERLALMLDDAQVKVLLTQESLLERLPEQMAQTICLDRDWAMIAEESAANPLGRALPRNIAYAIYTSGSTGRPKGVVVSHRNLTHSTLARISYYAEPVSAFLLLSSFAFDSSVVGLFWTLSQGGMLVIPGEGAHQDPVHLAKLIAHRSISHLLSFPALHALLLEQAAAGQLSSLRTVIVAGETCPTDLVERHREQLPQTLLFNEYGPTEATVWSSVYDCRSYTRVRSVPIGRPIANTRIYVLDSHLQPVPTGVVGELYIGGDGLARGYFNHPALTAERFIPDPFGHTPGARLYKTGDLARYLEDGNIEFTGRNDFQVKIRGYRIELGEIETALAQHPAIREAIVAAREVAPGNKRLVAYIVADEGQSPTARQLREFLKEKLPEYMLPASFVTLDAFPLTATGKIDRNALPVSEAGGEAKESYVAPCTAVEEVLARIFAAVLFLERVGIHDNFFEAGGHSLLATQVVSRVREAFEVELPLRKIFEKPSVAGLAEALLEDEGERKRIERTAELLLKLSQLSDDETDSLLEEIMGSVEEEQAR